MPITALPLGYLRIVPSAGSPQGSLEFKGRFELAILARPVGVQPAPRLAHSKSRNQISSHSSVPAEPLLGHTGVLFVGDVKVSGAISSPHTQTELVTFLAHARLDRLGSRVRRSELELFHEHEAFLYESLPAQSRRPRTDSKQVRRHVVRH